MARTDVSLATVTSNLSTTNTNLARTDVSLATVTSNLSTTNTNLARTDVSVNIALSDLIQQTYTSETNTTAITGNVTLADASSRLGVLGDISFVSKLYVGGDVSLNTKLNVAGDASFGNVVATRMLIAGDVSINTSKFFVGGDASFGGSIVTLNGNVQLGNGTRNVAINKVPGTTFALDVSGTTQMTGNVSIVKNPSDASYSFLDLTSVNLNLFGVAEKFVTGTTPATSLTFNCANGTIFEVSGVASGTRPTSISFTNVPNTVGRSVSITVILYKSTSNVDACYYDQTSVNVNGASITLQRPDGAAYTNPTAAVATHIHQFVIMWRSSTPTVFMYTSSLG